MTKIGTAVFGNQLRSRGRTVAREGQAQRMGKGEWGQTCGWLPLERLGRLPIAIESSREDQSSVREDSCPLLITIKVWSEVG